MPVAPARRAASPCGIPVRQETDDSLQCVRGYSGVRSAAPGRGGGHEDFWWCCNCLLKFRGVRSSTTPCEFCLLRTGEVWDAVQKAREGLETAEKAREKEAARVRLQELTEEKKHLSKMMNDTETEVRNMDGKTAALKAEIKELEELTHSTDESKVFIENAIERNIEAMKTITIDDIFQSTSLEKSTLETSVDSERDKIQKLRLMAELQQIASKLAKMTQLRNGISAYQHQIATIEMELVRLRTIIPT